MEKLLNLHEIMQLAQVEVRNQNTDDDSRVSSFRIDPEIRDAVQVICDRHGVSVGSFLRKCCEQLTKEYSTSTLEM